MGRAGQWAELTSFPIVSNTLYVYVKNKLYYVYIDIQGYILLQYIFLLWLDEAYVASRGGWTAN
jgi:hypothetical protein